MDIEKHLLKLIYEFAGKALPPEEAGSPNDVRQMLQAGTQGPKQAPQSAMNFEVVQVSILNPEIMIPIAKFLEKNKVSFKQNGQSFILTNIPADPIVIQLALNLPGDWIKIQAKEDKASIAKPVKVKGSIARAQALLSDDNSIENHNG